MITRGYEKGLILTRGYGLSVIAKAKRIYVAQKGKLSFTARKKGE